MAANSRMASAVQILCVMAYIGDGANSELIARSLRTNPVVVRRFLKCLERAGLVELRPGKDGGVRFLEAPDRITLDQVYAAVEKDAGLFALRRGGNPKCPVNRSMKGLLAPIFSETNVAVERILSNTTIGSMARSIK
jgi:DNA-binding IscR family transcriptional regulator